MKDEYFKTLIAIYVYEATGNVPKENMLKNIMENIRKQCGLSDKGEQNDG